MKTYLAGGGGGNQESYFFYILNINRLLSFADTIKNFGNSSRFKFLNYYIEASKMKKKISIFLDSGAYSAFTKNISIDINKYIDFIKQYEKYIDHYAVLDSIGDAEKTLENQKIMEERGLKPIPCYHYGEDIKYLKYYIDNYKYIALGGMVPISSRNLVLWLDNLFSNYLTDKKGFPKVKVHGFGLTSLNLMLRYPWYSVDSTSWVLTGRFGAVYVPKYIRGKYVYNDNCWKVNISNKSLDIKKEGEHISTFSKLEKKIIQDYFDLKGGYKIGKSEFKKEDKKGYKLKENEKWFGDKVEVIIEEGLCNTYQLRDELNIKYFLDLEKSIPEWPWAFKLNSTKGFLNR